MKTVVKQQSKKIIHYRSYMVCHFQSNLYKKKITHYSIVQDSIEGNHTFINMSFLNTSNNKDDIFHLCHRLTTNLLFTINF